MNSSGNSKVPKKENEGAAKPRKRRRLKKITNDIKDQLEFYFSQPNINKSEYMKEKVGRDGIEYVPIDQLLTFKSLQKLEASKNLVLRAVETSSHLQVNDAKTMIKRKEPLPSNYDPENATIFLDNLPLTATNEWVKELCLKIAPVAHVRTPVNNKGKIRGYAFVEFFGQTDAYRACGLINNPPENFLHKMALHRLKIRQRRSSKLSKALKRAKKRFLTRKDLRSRQQERERLLNLLLRTGMRCTNKDLEAVVSGKKKKFSLLRGNKAANRRTVRGKAVTGNTATTSGPSTSSVSSKKTFSKNNKDPRVARNVDRSKRGVKRSASGNNLASAGKSSSKAEDTRAAKKLKLVKMVNGKWMTIPSRPDAALVTSSTSAAPPLGGDGERHTNHNRLQQNGASSSSPSSNHQEVSSTTVDVDGKIAVGDGQPAEKRQLQSAVVAVEKKKRRRLRQNRLQRPKILGNVKPMIRAYLKREWKLLKHDFKIQQRSEMGKLKSIMRQSDCSGSNNKASGFIKHHIALNHKASDKEYDDEEEVVGPPVSYLDPITDPSDMGVPANQISSNNLSDDDDDRRPGCSKTGNIHRASVSSAASSKPYDYTAGVLVAVSKRRGPKVVGQDSCKFDWPEQIPLPRFEQLKRLFSQYGEVCYVDINPKGDSAVIRFRDAQSAQRAVLEEEQYKLLLLTGEAEERYWSVLLEARDRKLGREKVTKRRGRGHLIKRANKLIDQTGKKHIKFSRDFA